MRWLLFVLTLAIVLARGAHALACVNVTMNENEAVRTLKEAEIALDEGDVVTARDLGHRVARVYNMTAQQTDDPLLRRSVRVAALAYVRDREATNMQLQTAVTELERWIEVPDSLPGAPRPTPAMLADYGEALERAGQADEAWSVLLPLVDKDLVGSAYAYAAFHRLATTRGDAAHASVALARCETMALHAFVCRGEYPKRPFLRGRPADFVLVAAVFLGLALVRVLRKTPWSSHQARPLAFLVAAFGAAAFLLANLRHPWLAVIIMGPLLLFLAGQRSRWVNAVRAGRIPNLTVRRAEEGEAAPRTLAFLSGPAHPEVIAAAGPPTEGYRESARPEVLFRLVQSRVSTRQVLVMTAVVGVFAACAMMFLTTMRG